MYTTVYAYPWDILDESPQAFCTAVRDRLGVDTVSVAVSYHAAKLILPHNPRHKLYYPDDGALYFQPDSDTWRHSPIQPQVSVLAQEQDCLATICAAAEQGGLAVIAWTVCLHNTPLGRIYPEYTPRTAFGDPVIHYFCPAQPAARAYVCALASDVARRYPVRAIQLETAHHMPFVHGFHHEMQEVRVTPALQVLFGICFCSACLDAARAAGVDGDGVQRYVAGELERLLTVGGGESDPTAWQRSYWRDHLSGELERYLGLRDDAVAELHAEVISAVRAVGNVPVHIQDQSFVVTGEHRPAVDLAWLMGMDLPPRKGTADGVTVLGYFKGIDRFKEELQAYRACIPRSCPMEVGIRPSAPDCESADELAAKVAFCAELGVDGIAFYNYGQMPEISMAWVREALEKLDRSGVKPSKYI